jgi:hypothetical protein
MSSGPKKRPNNSKKKKQTTLNNPKLRAFKTSEVANKRGSALSADGSILRRSGATGSTSPISGQVNTRYGAKKGSVYTYGAESQKLKGAVAKKKKKTVAKKK